MAVKKEKFVAQIPANLPNLVFKDDGTIVVKKVWLSYPNLWEDKLKERTDPKTGEKIPKRFSASGIMPIATHKKEIIALKNYLRDLCREHFGMEVDPSNLCLRDGKYQPGDEYKSAWYLATGNTLERPPQTVDRNPSKEVTFKDHKLYPGALVNIMFKLWIQNNDYGKKINANLLIVQFVDDGKEFGEGSGPAASDAMDDISSEFPDEEEDIGGDDDDGLDDLDDDDL